jgi:hypothetical protein
MRFHWLVYKKHPKHVTKHLNLVGDFHILGHMFKDKIFSVQGGNSLQLFNH